MTMSRPPKKPRRRHASGDRFGKGRSSLARGESFRAAFPSGTACRASRRRDRLQFTVRRARQAIRAGSLTGWFALLRCRSSLSR